MRCDGEQSWIPFRRRTSDGMEPIAHRFVRGQVRERHEERRAVPPVEHGDRLRAMLRQLRPHGEHRMGKLLLRGTVARRQEHARVPHLLRIAWTRRPRLELRIHRVSVWTVEELIAAIANDVDTLECRDLFAPGFVTDALGDLIWSRTHGTEKRPAILRDVLRREGYAEQRAIVGHLEPADMPVLTLDSAMILVEAAMRKTNSTAAPSRDELQQAMTDLVGVGEATPVPGREGIIIRRGLV
jgi:hypothetical protein